MPVSPLTSPTAAPTMVGPTSSGLGESGRVLGSLPSVRPACAGGPNRSDVEVEIVAGLVLGSTTHALADGRERTPKGESRSEAVAGVLHEQGAHEVSQPVRQIGPDLVDVRDGLLDVRQRRRHFGAGTERWATCQHFEQHHTNGVQGRPARRTRDLGPAQEKGT